MTNRSSAASLLRCCIPYSLVTGTKYLVRNYLREEGLFFFFGSQFEGIQFIVVWKVGWEEYETADCICFMVKTRNEASS